MLLIFLASALDAFSTVGALASVSDPTVILLVCLLASTVAVHRQDPTATDECSRRSVASTEEAVDARSGRCQHP
ncbi:hypothetical protein [Micromonospora parva]|uniref:hypothetical protein n=1 Tax=Micromonospora parva TaxID=1464048 RepID=UPI0033D0C7E5